MTVNPDQEPMLSVTGQPVPVNETELMATAVAQVNQLTTGVAKLTRARRRERIIVGILILCVGGLLLGGWRLYTLVQDFHHAAYAACVAGNEYKRGDEEGWQKFIELATAGRPVTPAEAQFVSRFLAYIHSLDTPRACGSLYPAPGVLP